MDRYLRYNEAYDMSSSERVCMILYAYLVDYAGNIIGFRFKDDTWDDNSQVFVDVPIDKVIFSAKALSTEEIKAHVCNLTDKLMPIPISFVGNREVYVQFSNVALEILVNEYLVPKTEEKDTMSFYLPECVLRYKDSWFASEGYKLLDRVNMLFYESDFLDILGVTEVKYLQFIDKRSVMVKMKTYMGNELRFDKKFLLEQFAKAGVHIAIDPLNYDLLLSVDEPLSEIHKSPTMVSGAGWYSPNAVQGRKLIGLCKDECAVCQLSILDQATYKDDAKDYAYEAYEALSPDKFGFFYRFSPVEGDPHARKCTIMYKRYIPRELMESGFSQIKDFLESNEMEVLGTISSLNFFETSTPVYEGKGKFSAELSVAVQANVEMLGKDKVDKVKRTIVQKFIKYFQFVFQAQANYEELDKSFWFTINVMM